jgi:glycosyltransferase involved in cell wall biosynthesis
MPKVLRIINRLNLGGPTYNAANLTKYMEGDFETLLVAGMNDETEQSSVFILDKMGLKPVYIKEMYRELNPFRDYKAYFKLRKIIKEFKPDIVHTHAAKAGAVGRLAAYHAGVPIIVHTFHGHVFHSYFGKLKTKIFLEIERYLAKKSTAIVALSEIQRDELVNDFKIAPKEKFHIIPLGFDLHRFTEKQAEKRKSFREQYNIDDDEIAIGIVGRLVPVKNHSLFLKAVKQVSQKTIQKIRVYIIGDGEERATIESLALELGLTFNNKNLQEKNILTFTSWIKDIDISNAGMDIIALTSFNEGTPVSLIEAQASGKPIVSTNVGGIKNIVKQNETALLSASNDIDAFANNLLQLIESKEKRTEMSGKGVAFVMENFSHIRLAKDMSDLYNLLLKGNK